MFMKPLWRNTVVALSVIKLSNLKSINLELILMMLSPSEHI